MKISEKRMNALLQVRHKNVIDFYNLPLRERNWLLSERLITWSVNSCVCHHVKLTDYGRQACEAYDEANKKS